MLSKIFTASLWGMEADLVTVETDLQPGLPAINMVGLADITIKEAKERIRAAILNSGYEFPKRRITVNLSPAGKPKEGSHFDLPIAIGILLLGSKKALRIEDTAFIGELSLDGKIKHIRGALPLAIGLRDSGIRKLVLPEKNLQEAALLSDMELYPVANLQESMEYVLRPAARKLYQRKSKHTDSKPGHGEDFAEVVGQDSVKRALVVAAAGNHGILMVGNPGSGKTMMARRIPGIMPRMSYEEELEVTRIHSAAGLLSESHPSIEARPFRTPHHTISKSALIGGGRRPGPGELSLAHNGILFLDEFGEFDQRLTDLLRQPIEDEQVTISRAWGTVDFPCRTMLVAAANPCKCGYFGDETHMCTCTEKQLHTYFSKFSAPILDRIDLHIKVHPVSRAQLKMRQPSVSTEEMAANVKAAAQLQNERYTGTEIRFNSRLKPSQIVRYCPMSKEASELLQEAYDKLELNMRTYYKIIKVSRTIADLHRNDTIETYHIAEALQYRALEQFYRRPGRGN